MKCKKMDIVLLVLSIVLCAGIKLAFHACGPKEDGSWMTCHWAEQAVFACSIALVLMSVLRLFVESRYKAGLAMAMTVTAGTAQMIPGFLIHLCMMRDMRCHAVMRPAVMIVCILLMIAALADIWLHYSKELKSSGGEG